MVSEMGHVKAGQRGIGRCIEMVCPARWYTYIPMQPHPL